MKRLFKSILVIAVIICTYAVFIKFAEDPPDRKEEKQDLKLSNEESEEQAVKLPEEGLLSLMGQSSDQVVTKLGEPSRIDPSQYDYDWWIYDKGNKQYIQVGVLSGKVVSVYGIGDGVNMKPYRLGEPLSEVYQISPVSPSLSMDYEGNSYRFELSEEDMNTRPAVDMGEMVIQLYIDRFEGTLSSIRATDKATFIKQRPYEVVYRGKLINAGSLAASEEEAVQRAQERQIFDITNIIRNRHELEPLDWDNDTSKTAFSHSKDMADNQYFAHDSPTSGTLADRLKRDQIPYQTAGENIAAHYSDSISSVEGWLNSEGHRKALLNKEFTHLGVGVYKDYYTQDFTGKKN
ncbi:hypothetical protein CEF21_11160 [Bacillus sp. FJAT-42376]|uniref:CAP domain-containing protein n=1 Tax=Bacillus sp. FJAT-42376 TaxID=2014076 RepID=UPI000F4E4A1F|nr:CAP domain-containing protein [Bacillus sp. FJAT-42376]AZB44830.1 hypothetical protein CEF21_11160 [Bacillus sp. FJAT-42376]